MLLTKLNTSPWIFHIQKILLKPHHPDARTPPASLFVSLLTFKYTRKFVPAPMREDMRFNFHAVLPIGKRFIIRAAIVVKRG